MKLVLFITFYVFLRFFEDEEDDEDEEEEQFLHTVHVDFIWQTCWINFVAKNKCIKKGLVKISVWKNSDV